ncbi:Rgg/GadR/MutR family transcriptional regulator [Streptococcus uberis]|uniref:Rgg/GadR/MutR family transcriptional regulator n=1 Tax=Streptococcus uberis TaxID=1349 RepID=UPI0012B5B202|nr:Rgg/GadR/MutR family transcriptional regulator [Streptococcus uberis]MTB70381.1 Rgg/GadR/MutR family transcriptional regulator [Streptococcus uberis]
MAPLDAFHLGELYRELRLARGLKMKDVVNEKLSQAHLSKFENGQTMLSADKLFIALAAIHMSFAEFEHVYYQYEERPFFKQAKLISEYHSQKDIKKLHELLDFYDDNPETYDVYNRLNKLVIRCAINHLNPNHKISENDKEFMTTYLYSIDEWTEYELYIFGNTLHVLSDSDLIYLAKAFTERSSLYLSIPYHNDRTKIVFLNIIFSLMERKQFYYSGYFIQQLESILTYQDMFGKTVLNFLKLILDYHQKKNVKVNDLERFISILNHMGHNEVASFLQESMNHFI